MATVAQTNANRANAQKSTGPRTAQGKAIVAQNAVQHGLLAQREVLPGEDPGEFALFRDRMREDLDPMGALEGMLADRVVNLAWRLRRAERLEGTALATLESQHAARATDKPAPGDDPDDRETVLARVIVEDFRYGKVLDRLLGYERRIENSLYRTMNELRKQRLLREVEGSEFRLQAGQESIASAVTRPPEGGTRNTRVNADLQTVAGPLSLPPSACAPNASEEASCGVTTNGARDEGESRQTKPIDVGSSGDRGPGAETEEVGQGRPSYEETPCGVTTNRAESEDEVRQTNPVDAGSPDDQASAAAMEEVGRGRPSYEEAAVDGAQHSNLPSFQDSSPLAGQSRETKPNEAASEKSQVTSQPG